MPSCVCSHECLLAANIDIASGEHAIIVKSCEVFKGNDVVELIGRVVRAPAIDRIREGQNIVLSPYCHISIVISASARRTDLLMLKSYT